MESHLLIVTRPRRSAGPRRWVTTTVVLAISAVAMAAGKTNAQPQSVRIDTLSLSNGPQTIAAVIDGEQVLVRLRFANDCLADRGADPRFVALTGDLGFILVVLRKSGHSGCPDIFRPVQRDLAISFSPFAGLATVRTTLIDDLFRTDGSLAVRAPITLSRHGDDQIRAAFTHPAALLTLGAKPTPVAAVSVAEVAEDRRWLYALSLTLGNVATAQTTARILRIESRISGDETADSPVTDWILVTGGRSGQEISAFFGGIGGLPRRVAIIGASATSGNLFRFLPVN